MPLLILYFLAALITAFFIGVWQQEYAYHLLLSYLAWCVLYLVLSFKRERYPLSHLIFLGALTRLFYILLPDVLTGDLPRYLWEGELLRNGISPYLYPPNEENLKGLRTEYWHFIEYKSLSAIYPPVAQYFLALFAWTSITWKLFLFFVELINLGLILKILKKYMVREKNVAWYALLPLPIIEIVGAGHLEGLLASFFLLALLYDSAACKGGFYAAGSLVKYVLALPVGILASLLLIEKNYRNSLALIAVYTILLFVLSFPFLDREFSLFSSLKEYVTHWRFNDSLHYLIGESFGVDWSDLRTFGWIKVALFGFWALCVSTIILARVELHKAALLSFMLYLLQSSVVHPWYGLWFAPLIVLWQFPAALYFLLALPLSYSARVLGLESVPDTVLAIEYLPVYLFLIYSLLTNQKFNDVESKKTCRKNVT